MAPTTPSPEENYFIYRWVSSRAAKRACWHMRVILNAQFITFTMLMVMREAKSTIKERNVLSLLSTMTVHVTESASQAIAYRKLA